MTIEQTEIENLIKDSKGIIENIEYARYRMSYALQKLPGQLANEYDIWQQIERTNLNILDIVNSIITILQRKN